MLRALPTPLCALTLLLAGCSNPEPMFKPSGAPKVKMAIRLAKPAPFPGAQEQALPAHMRTETLEKLFVAKDAALVNDDVAGTNVSKQKHDPNLWQIEVFLKPAARDKLAQVTKDNIGNYLAIYFDEQFVIAPQIRSEVRDGLANISGNYTEAEATRLAKSIVGQ